MEEKFDFIAKHFSENMKAMPATSVYNAFSKYVIASSIEEAKELLQFIRELQKMDGYWTKFY